MKISDLIGTVNKLNTHGMTESFQFQFVRKDTSLVASLPTATGHEYTYCFQYDVPIISTTGSAVVETRHLTLLKVFKTAFPPPRDECAIDMHWQWLSPGAKQEILGTAHRYVSGALCKLNGKLFTWRDVFDCKVVDGMHKWGHISWAVKAAHHAGFGMIAWNNRLVKVLSANDWIMTDWTVDNVV